MKRTLLTGCLLCLIALPAFAFPHGTEGLSLEEREEEWTRYFYGIIHRYIPPAERPCGIQIFILDHPTPQAIATHRPYCRITVTTGLLDFMKDDDEFAFVILHEVGHLWCRETDCMAPHERRFGPFFVCLMAIRTPKMWHGKVIHWEMTLFGAQCFESELEDLVQTESIPDFFAVRHMGDDAQAACVGARLFSKLYGNAKRNGTPSDRVSRSIERRRRDFLEKACEP